MARLARACDWPGQVIISPDAPSASDGRDVHSAHCMSTPRQSTTPYPIVNASNARVNAVDIPCTTPQPARPTPSPGSGPRPHPERRPKSPCTSSRIRNAFRARTCAMSSRCEVRLVSTSFPVLAYGNFPHRPNQHPHRLVKRADPTYWQILRPIPGPPSISPFSYTH